jgi:hypothetical protein
MKTELFKKVYILSEADLPKDGQYIAHYKKYDNNSPAGTVLCYFNHLNQHQKDNWLNNIDWYLQPIADELTQGQEKPDLTDNTTYIKEWFKNSEILSNHRKADSKNKIKPDLTDEEIEKWANMKYGKGWIIRKDGAVEGIKDYCSGKIHEWLKSNK